MISNGQELVSTDIYNGWAENYERDITDMGWSAPGEILKNAAPHLEDGQKVFEAGIGTGFLADKFMSVANVEVKGCDISAKMLDLCLRKGRVPYDHLSLVDLNTDDVPEESAHFDHVISCGVLEYVENIDHALDELARLTAEGGIITLAYEGTFEEKGSRAIRKDKSGGDFFNYYHHCPEDLEDALREHGIFPQSHYTFQSIAEGEPINYTLYQGVKLPSP